jgi:hypothetical protein
LVYGIFLPANRTTQFNFPAKYVILQQKAVYSLAAPMEFYKDMIKIKADPGTPYREEHAIRWTEEAKREGRNTTEHHPFVRLGKCQSE